MILTKLKSYHTDGGSTLYEYVNLEAVDEVEILTDYYEVIMSSHYRHEIDLTDPVITALIAAADAA